MLVAKCLFGTAQALSSLTNFWSHPWMPIMKPCSFSLKTPLVLLALVTALAVTGAGVSNVAAAEDDLRIVPQIAAGTSGFEPGVALEWRSADLFPVVVRPEALISEDGRPGGGAAVLWDISSMIDFREHQALAIGPRAVYHNSDKSGWEIDALATWTLELSARHRKWEHALGVLGAIGVLHNKEHDENDVGATGGVFYSYRF